MSLESYSNLTNIHSIGTFLCLRAVLRVMLQQEPRETPSGPPTRHTGRGSIVIVTSLASEGAFLGVGNYVAAKHAVKGLVQTAGESIALPLLQSVSVPSLTRTYSS